MSVLRKVIFGALSDIKNFNSFGVNLQSGLEYKSKKLKMLKHS